jgi:hypothetical protein
MIAKSIPLARRATTATAISTTRPSAAGDGVATTTLRGYARVSIILDADAARTIADPTDGTEGVELWGYESSQWSLVGILNGGADIAIIGDGQGRGFTVDMGRSYDRLVVAGTKSGGTVTFRVVPIEIWG